MAKPAKRKAPKKGRPTGLTKEIHKALVAKVRKVCFLDKAAELVGIPGSTVREWFERGLGNVEGRPRTPLYAAFARDVTRARAESLEAKLERIDEGGEGGFVVEESVETRKDGSVIKRIKRQPPDWRADAWVAERIDRQNFGRVSTQHIEGSLTVKHVDALALALLGIMRRYVPADQLEAVGVEVGNAIDTALGTPRLQITGPIKPDGQVAA